MVGKKQEFAENGDSLAEIWVFLHFHSFKVVHKLLYSPSLLNFYIPWLKKRGERGRNKRKSEVKPDFLKRTVHCEINFVTYKESFFKGSKT